MVLKTALLSKRNLNPILASRPFTLGTAHFFEEKDQIDNVVSGQAHSQLDDWRDTYRYICFDLRTQLANDKDF